MNKTRVTVGVELPEERGIVTQGDVIKRMKEVRDRKKVGPLFPLRRVLISKKAVLIPFVSVLILQPICSYAQIAQGLEDFVARTFHSSISEIPRMAWLVPPNTVIAEEKHASIYLYSISKRIEQARYLGVIGKEELTEIRKKHHVMCDPVDQTQYHPFYKYEFPGEIGKFPDRVFYTSRPLTGGVRGGFRTAEQSGEILENIRGWVKKDKLQFLHKHFAISALEPSHIYSFHGFYDADTKEMFKESIVLTAPDGRILGRKFADVSWETVCDGCGLPTYDDGLPSSSSLINLFSFPQFSFPVLLLDTSTVEGRAISLATFDRNGAYSEYRLYEYVVNCF